MALPLVFKTQVSRLNGVFTLKAVDAYEFYTNDWDPRRSVLLLDRVPLEQQAQLLNIPWAAIMTASPDAVAYIWPVVRSPIPHEAVGPGDIIEVGSERPTLRVLYRRGDNGNVLFATERCNSYCLMCSQPPRHIEDQWRVQQNIDLIDLIDRDEKSLAITGGEPTLLGEGLISLISACKMSLPSTELQILTNGRALANNDLAEQAALINHPRLQWNVPLYADVAPIHDYVVQSAGAFQDTVRGLYRLAEAKQAIEIRVVLHKPTIPRLTALVHFIYRNLTFVRHVALMGLESIGFALANREALWIDPLDYQDQLLEAVEYLQDRGIAVSIYNLPLCVLPRSLWPYAAKSISDWKNVYLPQCQACAARTRCSGFFASISEEWTSRGVAPIATV